MSNQTPRAAVRGVRQRIPAGYVVGRHPSAGDGAAQLIPLSSLADALRLTGRIVTGNVPSSGVTGGGTVTSVGLSMPAEYTVSQTPITGYGTLTVTKANQSANVVYAGPSSGAAAQPTFRALVGADLPAPGLTTLGGIEAVAQVSHQWVQYIDTSGVPHLTQPAFTDLSGNIATSQMNSGTSASSTTFWRGDGTWAAPAGSVSGASLQVSPTNPTGTTSTTGKMMGIGGVCSITPASSGKVVISISGLINNNTAGDGAECGIRYGTGTAPANGAVPAGSAIGADAIGVVGTPSGTLYAPFCVQAIATGLVVGTPYWIDLDLLAVTGGTASVVNLAVCAFEVP